MSRKQILSVAGALWGIIGLFLIFRGTQMYGLAVNEQNATQASVAMSVAASLLLGAFKGMKVLSKTASRNRSRIEQLDAPLKLHQIFSPPFYALIAGMMLLGVVLRTWNVLLGGYIVVAAIYCGIGIALITASRIYWKNSPANEET